MGHLISTLAFPVPPKEWGEESLKYRETLDIPLATGEKIRAIYIQNFRTPCRTIFYSHGNAEDLGLCIPYLDRMSEVCSANVFAYDYCGYGFSEGVASEENCYVSVDAAYQHLVERERVDPNLIAAFGRSIGSGPTVDLVSRHPEIRAMVLQSPIESGARAVFNETVSWFGYSLDIFKNYEKITQCKQKVLVMHGTADTVVPHSNGVAIHNACENAVEPLWLNGRGHNDMPDIQCLKKVKEFLDDLCLPAGQQSSRQ